jgi:outer membrane protein TolC
MLALLVLPASAHSAPMEDSSAGAGERPGYGYADPSSLADADLAEPPGEPLSLADAIALGLRNNLDVEVNRYAPYVSQLDSEAAWGAYDPLFTGSVSYDDTIERNVFLRQLTGNENNTTTSLGGQAGIGALIPYWGASVELSFDGARSETNNPIQALLPRYDSGITVGGTVPLMRGLIWNEAWTQVKTSRLAYEADLDTFTTSVMDTVQSIIRAYWNLVASKEDVRVKKKSLESTQALLDQTKTQYQVGVVSKVEVVQAEAGVANAEFELIVSRNQYRNAQDQLIAAVLGDRLRADTVLTFDPTDNPQFTEVEPIDLDQAVQMAFTNRPELAAAERRLDQGEVQLKFAKNQRLPQVDLDVSYRTAGTTGRARTPGSAIAEGPFGDTFDSYWVGGEPQELRAMGVVSIPLGNITARKNVTKARIELRRANSQITRLKQQIIVSVRTAARTLLASAQGVEAAERRRLAAEEQLRAEKIRLEHGESTPFDVLQRERDLVEAESQKIGALQAFRNSQAELERQQGTILDAWDVMIGSVRSLDYQEPLRARY